MKLKSVLFLWGVAVFQLASAQWQQIDSLLNSYNEKVPQEKIYIHFDNTQYLPGQTLWYKAYLQKGNEVSDISRNLYLEWFDEEGKLLTRIVAPIVGSCASGSYTVPEKFSGQRLRVIAYTQWMQNFDTAFFYHKTIPVIQTSAVANQPSLVPVAQLHFFPEGGDMVAGLNSLIAFKATNSSGLPIEVSGRVLNQKKEIVSSFSSVHDGMGKFSITPVAGDSYQAEWRDPQGVLRTTGLPWVKNEGIVMKMNTDITPPSFTIERKTDAATKFKRLTVLATMNGQLQFKAIANLTEKNSITASVPTSSFATGILLVTVFDMDQQPVAERAVFINNGEYQVAANLVTDTLNLDKRGKNIYHIAIEDTVHASLSLSIMDGEGMLDSSDHIISHLLLSSEVKGYIHEPAYYFSSEEDSVRQHLDLVMMTNGWRRFAWENIIGSSIPALKYARDSNYLSIEGNISKLSDAKIKKAETLNLIVVAKDSTKQFLFADLQPDGSFRENNIILFDTSKIYYQLNKTFLPAKSQVKINNSFLPYDSTSRMAALEKYLPDTTGFARVKAIEAEQHRIEELIRQSTLQEVVVKTKVKTRIQEMNEKYTRGLFSNSFAHDFDITDDRFAISSQNALMYLQSKVAGLSITNPTGPNPVLQWRQRGVSLFVDEFPADASVVQSIHMGSIAFIKVFNPPFSGNIGGGANGAIAIYTRKGDDLNSQFTGLDYTVLPGYTPVKEFYSPDYAMPQVNFTRTDLRRTLLWKPNIQYEGDGKKIELSFYNNDISHTLQLVLEGMTQEGRLIRLSRTLK